MAHRIGQQLGSYRLTRLLGLGGFAEVYLGEHILVSGKQAAIKVLKEEYTDAELHSFCYAVGGLSIALIGIWFIAESGWQSAMVSWVVGGMAIIIGCVIFIVAFLL